MLLGISPSEGSIAGSTIYASIAGVGFDISDATLVDDAGTEICQTATITEYGELECQTIEGEIAESTLLYLSVSSVTYNCSASDEGDCHYQQITDAMATV